MGWVANWIQQNLYILRLDDTVTVILRYVHSSGRVNAN